MIRATIALLYVGAAAQTLPRPAAPLEFTLISPKSGTARLVDYKGKIVVLYLFSPD